MRHWHPRGLCSSPPLLSSVTTGCGRYTLTGIDALRHRRAGTHRGTTGSGECASLLVCSRSPDKRRSIAIGVHQWHPRGLCSSQPLLSSGTTAGGWTPREGSVFSEDCGTAQSPYFLQCCQCRHGHKKHVSAPSAQRQPSWWFVRQWLSRCTWPAPVLYLRRLGLLQH